MESSYQSSRRGSPLILCVVLGGILLVHGANELRYSVWGKSATAWVTMTSIRETYNKGTKWYHLRIDYSFRDADGVDRSESDESATSCGTPTAPNIGDAIQVQYLQPGTSRPASRADPGSVYLCVAFIVAAVGWAALFGLN